MESPRREILYREEKRILIWFKWFIIIFAVGFLLWHTLPPLKNIILLFLLGLIIAYLLDPIVTVFEDKGLPRIFSIIILFFAIGILLYFAGYFLFPVIKREIGGLIQSVESQKIQTVTAKLKEFLLNNFPFIHEDQIDQSIRELSGQFRDIVISFSRKSLGYIQGIFSIITYIIIVPLISFFVLKDGVTLKRSLVQIVPNKYFEMFLHLFYKTDKQIGSYIRGQIVDNAILAVFYCIGYYYLDIPYFVVFGAFSGMANVIPYIGPVIGATPPIIVAIIETGSFGIVPMIIILFIIIQIIENAVVQPNVVARSVDLHPLIIIFAVLTGGTVLGIIGMLFSVLLAGVIKVVIVELIWSYKNYKLGDRPRRRQDNLIISGSK